MNKTTQFFDRSSFFSLCALVLLLPFSTAAVEIFSSLAILTWLVSKCVSRSWLKHKLPIYLPLCAYLIAVLLSVIFSQYPDLSWRAYFSKLLQTVLLLIVSIEVLSQAHRIKVFLSTGIISLAAILADALVQQFTGRDLIKGYGAIADYRIRATFPHSNDFGAYLNIAVIIALGLAIGLIWTHRDYWQKVLPRFLPPLVVGIIVFVGLTVLGLTYSRSAWLGVMISLFGWSCFSRRHLIASVAVGILFVSFFIPSLMEKRQDLSDASGQFSITQLIGGSGRSAFWSQALDFFQEAPLTGTGLNTYAQKVEEVFVPVDEDDHPYYAHNCYLQLLAETGVLGLMSFLWLIGAIFWTCVCRLKHYVKQPLGMVLLSVSAALAGFLVECFFDTSLYSPRLAMCFWMACGLAIATRVVLDQ